MSQVKSGFCLVAQVPIKLKVELEQYFLLIMVLEYIILHSAVEQEQFEKKEWQKKIVNVQNEA